MTLTYATYAVEDGIDYPVNATWWNTFLSAWDIRLDNLEDQDMTVDGIKTYSSIPVGPATDPTSDNQLARKKYVDDNFTASGHAHTESDITDLVHNATLLQSRLLSSSAPSDGEALVWNDGGSTWEPGSLSASSTNLGGLADVTLTSLAQGNVLYYNGSAWVNLAVGTDGQLLQTQGAADNPQWVSRTRVLEYVIDGGGSAITTGEKGHLEVPFACTITAARALADQSGSIVVDIWKDSYGNLPPTNADSITAAAPVTISGTVKSQDTTLTSWTTAISAGDWLAYNVDSITTVERVTISLTVTIP